MSCCDNDFSYYCPKKQRKVFFDYYALLNIDRCATDDQIKKAYRNLAKQYHPDKVNHDIKEICKEKFKIIADAYQNLLDPERRSHYNSILKQMELKQNAKKQNYQGVCSILQSCSTQELMYVLFNTYVNKQEQPHQYYDCNQKQQEYFNKNINNNNNFASNNNYFSTLNNSSKCEPSQFNWSSQVNNMNNNSFNCNPQANGFSDDENGSEESEGEPQCQGSDASSTQSEQNFYQKFSFFNNINTKETLNPENFTFLKGIFTNNCNQQDIKQSNDEFSQRFYQYQQQNKTKVEETKVDASSEKSSTQQQMKENSGSSDNNCNYQQNNSNQSMKTNLEEMECENQNAESANSIQIDEEQKSEKSKKRLTKAHIQLLQKDNQNKKIIERIRNKKLIFSTLLCKRIKKQY